MNKFLLSFLVVGLLSFNVFAEDIKSQPVKPLDEMRIELDDDYVNGKDYIFDLEVIHDHHSKPIMQLVKPISLSKKEFKQLKAIMEDSNKKTDIGLSVKIDDKGEAFVEIYIGEKQ
jgi:hypothetical protein